MRTLIVQIAVTLLVVLVGYGASVQLGCTCEEIDASQDTCSNSGGITTPTNPTSSTPSPGSTVDGTCIHKDTQAQYCSICSDHPGCKPLSSNCDSKTNVSLYTFTDADRKYFLNCLNKKRNSVASGTAGLPAAKRMASVSWDCRLENFAAENVKQCQNSYDSNECRLTSDFPNPGQIAVTFGTTGGFQPIREVLDSACDFWSKQPVTANDVAGLKNENQTHYNEITATTQFLQEEFQWAGCSIMRYKNTNDVFHFSSIVCDTSVGNSLNKPVYQTGAPASACAKGTHDDHTSLCALSESYNLFD